ncbi:MAG: AAC(3) family N-acetyltransferase [Planctomycetota bacterium]
MSEPTGESNAIARAGNSPATVDSLATDLRNLGVRPGMTLLVHSSLSSLGWVCGGAVAVIYALQHALGPEGTLVMPTHTCDLSEPSNWSNPPVPKSWWQSIRDSMPVFDRQLTPTRGMGQVPETFRTQNGALRSNHPHMSFSARGPNARLITSDHALESGLGEHSPLSHIYDLEGSILLLGVNHESNTSIHLSEYRADVSGKKRIRTGAPIMIDNCRQWCEFDELDLETADFNRLGEEFATATQLVRSGNVGKAHSLLMPQRALVDFAVTWMEANR